MKSNKLYLYLSPVKLTKEWRLNHKTDKGPLVLISEVKGVSVGFKPIKKISKKYEIWIKAFVFDKNNIYEWKG